MSNVLFRTPFYKGIIINTTKIKSKNEADGEIELSCGASIQPIIREYAYLDLGGMEGLYGIPGTVGGMLRQNAGAFGYEISDCFVSARCFSKDTLSVDTYDKNGMRFSYRDSILADNSLVLLSARFRLRPKMKKDILDEIARYSKKRRDTQPIGKPSLGSVFKRVGDVSAAFYIDNAGLKGLTFGGAMVSEKHAGFIVNIGGATSYDYLKLIEIIKSKVLMTFGIDLEEEIQII